MKPLTANDVHINEKPYAFLLEAKQLETKKKKKRKETVVGIC